MGARRQQLPLASGQQPEYAERGLVRWVRAFWWPVNRRKLGRARWKYLTHEEVEKKSDKMTEETWQWSVITDTKKSNVSEHFSRTRTYLTYSWPKLNWLASPILLRLNVYWLWKKKTFLRSLWNEVVKTSHFRSQIMWGQCPSPLSRCLTFQGTHSHQLSRLRKFTAPNRYCIIMP